MLRHCWWVGPFFTGDGSTEIQLWMNEWMGKCCCGWNLADIFPIYRSNKLHPRCCCRYPLCKATEKDLKQHPTMASEITTERIHTQDCTEADLSPFQDGHGFILQGNGSLGKWNKTQHILVDENAHQAIHKMCTQQIQRPNLDEIQYSSYIIQCNSLLRQIVAVLY